MFAREHFDTNTPPNNTRIEKEQHSQKDAGYSFQRKPKKRVISMYIPAPANPLDQWQIQSNFAY